MTFSLRRKRPITVVRSTPARMAASLLSLGLLLSGAQAWAQDTPQPTVEPVKTLHFSKPANSTAGADSARKPVAPATSSQDVGRNPALAQQPAPAAPFLPPKAPALAFPEFATPQRKEPARSSPQNVETKRFIRQISYQPQQPSVRAPEEGQEYLIQLEPPGPQRIFRLEGESAWQERIRQEARERPTPERVAFPEEPVVGRGPYAPRVFSRGNLEVEPNYVCYQRLYFEDLNSERYGWDLGFVQPFVSAGEFYWDFLTLPYHMGTEPCRTYECSAGYCLPGDPVPYLLYPPQFSITGTLAEAAAVVGMLVVFP